MSDEMLTVEQRLENHFGEKRLSAKPGQQGYIRADELADAAKRAQRSRTDDIERQRGVTAGEQHIAELAAADSFRKKQLDEAKAALNPDT